MSERVDCRRLYIRGVREDCLEKGTHVQAECMTLVVVDVATGEGSQVQMPDKHLVAERQRGKPVRVQLDDGHVVYALEKIGPFRTQSTLRVRAYGVPTTGDRESVP
jgi:hypothetical protein